MRAKPAHFSGHLPIVFEDAMQYCEKCYNELLANGELLRISDVEQKKIDENIRMRNEVLEIHGPIRFDDGY